MAGAGSYLQEMIQLWGNLGTGYARRLQRASDEARSGRYRPSRLFADSVAMWMEGVDAWWSVALGRRAAEPAVVFFRLRGTEAKQKLVRIAVPGDGAPEWTDLVRINKDGATIPRDNVRVEVGRYRDELTVKLVDLKGAHVPEGHYVGLVHADERVLVVVHVIVEP
jgi:hypothetical protein